MHISKLSASDKQARLEQLKRAVYQTGSYSFDLVLDLHAAKLRAIELGRKSWDSDFSNLEQQMLLGAKGRGKQTAGGSLGGGASKEPRVFYCRDFQSGQCNKADNVHYTIFKGRKVLAHHVCARCLLRKRDLKQHPENWEDCPSK